MKKTIRIQTRDGSYPIRIERGLRSRLPELVEEQGLERIVVVTDATVSDLYLDDLGFDDAPVVVLPDGEQTKTLEQAQRIFDELLEHGALPTRSAILALGGGVVCDVAAFAAALYQTRILHVPTSLVAMVDLALDGRTALNHPARKDLFQASAVPTAVWIDPEVLETLPQAEIEAGLDVALRHGVGHDPTLLSVLDEHLYELRQEHSPPFLEAIILNSIRLKRRLLRMGEGSLDPLAFGRPIGLGLEAALGLGTLRYGEALLIGLAATLEISRRKDLLTKVVFHRLAELLERLAVPEGWDAYDPERLKEALRWDRPDRLEIYLLADVGCPILRTDVRLEEVLCGLGFASEVLPGRAA